MAKSDTTTGTTLPLLVLVSGAPGTGKTTLADHLSQALSLPRLSKDTIREIMIDAFNIQSWEESKSIGVPAYRVYYGVIAQLLAAGISTIADCNFHRGVSEHDVGRLIAKAHGVLIHCRTTHTTSTQRFIERSQQPDRRHAAMDAERLAQIEAGQFEVPWWAYDEPMQLDVPTLVVDTTAGYTPSIDAIVDFVHSASSDHMYAHNAPAH